MTNQDLSEMQLDDRIRDAATTLAQLVIQRAPDGPYGPETARAIVKQVMATALRNAGSTPIMGDGRQRRWHIEAKFVVTEFDGRASEAMKGTSVENGFDGVARWIHAGAVYAFERRGGLPEAMRVHHIFDKLQNLRPTVTRRKGKAAMRYKFTDARGRPCALHALIFRSDAYAAHLEAQRVMGQAASASNGETVRNLRAGRPAPVVGPSVVAPGELDD